jgi:acetyl esterase/lipase
VCSDGLANRKRTRWAVPFSLVFLLFLGGGTFLFARAQDYPEPPPTLTLRRDVSYAIVDGQSLSMDVVVPKVGKGPFPAVLCIHGGGWSSGHKKDMVGCAYMLSQLGFVTTSIDYRLAPQAHFPAQVEDAKAAVRYMRSHAKELDIDPNRIGVLGSSAGGHLALFLGTTDKLPSDDTSQSQVSSAVKAVVSLAGPTSLSLPLPPNSEKIAERFIGKSRSESPNLFESASPAHYLTAATAPILMIHGNKDELVPYNQATTMLAACKKAGVEAELITIADGGHGGGGNQAEWDASILKMAEFLTKHLKQ